MNNYILSLTFLSDSTPGSGDGLPGLVDREIVHDRYGMAYMRGRTIKGLLSEEADNILFSLERQGRLTQEYILARKALFGDPGSLLDEQAIVHYGRALLPKNLYQMIKESVKDPERESEADQQHKLSRADILESMTAIRRQTAIEGVWQSPAEREKRGEANANYKPGTPVDGSLRGMRVLLRQTKLHCEISALQPLEPAEFALLCASVKALRRAGTGRNRGRGRLEADLQDSQEESVLVSGFAKFAKNLEGGSE